jgi:hypothetical protein
MSYGEKRQKQKFKVKFTVYYPSGKKWTEERETYAYSEIGVRETIEWLKGSKEVYFHYIRGTGIYGGPEVYPDGQCLGDR